MVIGILKVELRIPGSDSLKYKRRVLKSIIHRLRNKFNISVTEIDTKDKWKIASLGIAGVSSQKRLVQQQLSIIENFLERCPEILVLNTQIEIL